MPKDVPFGGARVVSACNMTNRIAYRSELDGLRCFAVCLVLIAHLPFATDFQLWNGVKWFGTAIHAGYLGVDIFFVLSGFLITRILLSEREQPLGPTIRTFFFKRVLRIFPIYYLTVFLLLDDVEYSSRGSSRQPALRLELLL